MYTSTAEQIKERIEQGLTDIGLLKEPVDVGKYQFLRLAEQELWGVLIPVGNPLSQAECVTAEDLTGLPLLMPGRDSVRHEVANWFGGYYESLSMLATYDLVYNAVVLAETAGAAVLCMEHDKDYKNMRFVPLTPSLSTGSVLVWKKEQAMSAAMRCFTEYLENVE